ncbi:MAG: AAA family ATPase [bacterium]|nr:AAA family ATPase [bacterium]
MLIGHEKQIKYFKNLIENDVLGHAYLFTGPEMIGKKTFALELVKTMFNGEVEQNLDFRFIEPKFSEKESKIYIEDIRDLKKFLSFKSYSGNRRLVVLNDAHSLTSEAANAFLKILEEPPMGSVIILVSSTPGLLPKTILSRCEEVKFFPLSSEKVTDFVSQNKKLNKEDKDFLVRIAGGRIGLVKSLIESGDVSKAKSSVDDLRKLLSKGVFERMEYAKKIYESEKYPETVNYWLSWVSAHLASSSKNKKIVENLLALNQLISQPQFNHRLALENFLLNL